MFKAVQNYLNVLVADVGNILGIRVVSVHVLDGLVSSVGVQGVVVAQNQLSDFLVEEVLAYRKVRLQTAVIV